MSGVANAVPGGDRAIALPIGGSVPGRTFFRLLAFVVLVPVVLGGLMILGARRGFLSTTFAIALIAFLMMVSLIALLAFSAMQIQRVAAQALVDGLTGLGNRSFFDRRLVAERSLARRYERPLSIIMIDVDDFKAVNDVHGHQGGDVVLRDLARLLMGGCRGEDAACRFGGDEFLLVLPNTPLEGARVVAERMRLSIANHEFSHRGLLIRITCSFGVSTLTDDDAATLMDVDQAMYKAKQSGRNQVTVAAVGAQ